MTATEVLERSAEIARVLGATFGRLQSELLTPLVLRGLAVLARRGEIPEIAVDGRAVVLQYRSPLARLQAQAEVQNALLWVEAAAAAGAEAAASVDRARLGRWMAETLGVPADLVRGAGDV